jgi:hypothetical protein
MLKHLGNLTLVVAAAVWTVAGAVALAEPPIHYLHAGVLAPGAIGAAQLQRGGPLPGYFQPLEIRAPQGVSVSFVCDSRFTEPQTAPVKTAMLIGPVYRLRISGIPRRPGEEVYPTIEVINRLYPPIGEELRFPVPIELTQEDLEAAIDGKFITRVIYLEDPRAAYARGEDPKTQYTVEVGPHEDPLVTADHLGRPMAIVRIGGRLPLDPENPDDDFLYHSPPLLRFVRPANATR